MSARPLILITNDDGIHHPGLAAAARAALPLGEVVVAAPRTSQNSTGRSYPKGDSVGSITRVALEGLGCEPTKVAAFSIDGSPAQCVAYAVLELCPRPPALCISGINFGENLGTTLTGSGTLGAAFEADCFEIPSLAVSLQVLPGDMPGSVNWDVPSHFTNRFADAILDHGLPRDVGILNMNLPARALRESQVRRTRDSRQPFWIFRKPERTDLGAPASLPVTSEIKLDTLEPDSDIKACIIDGVVSITPIRNSLAYEGEWDLRLT